MLIRVFIVIKKTIHYALNFLAFFELTIFKKHLNESVHNFASFLFHYYAFLYSNLIDLTSNPFGGHVVQRYLVWFSSNLYLIYFLLIAIFIWEVDDFILALLNFEVFKTDGMIDYHFEHFFFILFEIFVKHAIKRVTIPLKHQNLCNWIFDF